MKINRLGLNRFCISIFFVFLLTSVFYLMTLPTVNASSRTLSEVSVQIMSAPANKVYFIYSDPYRMVSPDVDWSAAFAAYDSTAEGFLYGLCTNEQKICYDSDGSIVVSQPAGDYGRVLLASKSVVVMGGPVPNWVVDYYEFSDQTPLKYNWDSANPGFANQAETTVASLSSTTDFKHNDLFVVETFQDANSNFVLIIYGLGWKGTFAGGVYFKEVLSKSLPNYAKNAYVFKWTDAGTMDGVPQASEIAQIYSAP